MKNDLQDAMKNLVELHKTKTCTLRQFYTVDAHRQKIIDFMQTKFSFNHVAEVAKALFPCTRVKIIEFVTSVAMFAVSVYAYNAT